MLITFPFDINQPEKTIVIQSVEYGAYNSFLPVYISYIFDANNDNIHNIFFGNKNETFDFALKSTQCGNEYFFGTHLLLTVNEWFHYNQDDVSAFKIWCLSNIFTGDLRRV